MCFEEITCWSRFFKLILLTKCVEDLISTNLPLFGVLTIIVFWTKYCSKITFWRKIIEPIKGFNVISCHNEDYHNQLLRYLKVFPVVYRWNSLLSESLSHRYFNSMFLGSPISRSNSRTMGIYNEKVTNPSKYPNQ